MRIVVQLFVLTIGVIAVSANVGYNLAADTPAIDHEDYETTADSDSESNGSFADTATDSSAMTQLFPLKDQESDESEDQRKRSVSQSPASKGYGERQSADYPSSLNPESGLQSWDDSVHDSLNSAEEHKSQPYFPVLPIPSPVTSESRNDRSHESGATRLLSSASTKGWNSRSESRTAPHTSLNPLIRRTGLFQPSIGTKTTAFSVAHSGYRPAVRGSGQESGPDIYERVGFGALKSPFGFTNVATAAVKSPVRTSVQSSAKGIAIGERGGTAYASTAGRKVAAGRGDSDIGLRHKGSTRGSQTGTSYPATAPAIQRPAVGQQVLSPAAKGGRSYSSSNSGSRNSYSTSGVSTSSGSVSGYSNSGTKKSAVSAIKRPAVGQQVLSQAAKGGRSYSSSNSGSRNSYSPNGVSVSGYSDSGTRESAVPAIKRPAVGQQVLSQAAKGGRSYGVGEDGTRRYSSSSPNGRSSGRNTGFNGNAVSGNRYSTSDDSDSGYGDSDGSEGHSVALYAFGVPGEDFPIFRSVPRTGFSCRHRTPGYYADVRTGCQAFYICQSDGRMDGFLCPNSTVFSQQLLTCDYWIHVNCDDSEKHTGVNDKLYQSKPSSAGLSSSSYPSTYSSSSSSSASVSPLGANDVPYSPATSVRTSGADFRTVDRRGERRLTLSVGNRKSTSSDRQVNPLPPQQYSTASSKATDDNGLSRTLSEETDDDYGFEAKSAAKS